MRENRRDRKEKPPERCKQKDKREQNKRDGRHLNGGDSDGELG